MKYVKKEQGITLIALVVTIILLLILSSLTITTITTITQNNGILIRAQEAMNKTEEAKDKENIE